MEINRKNYEIYAIDFMDGVLSPSDAAEFLAFLADNPDISNEVEMLRENTCYIPASNEPVSFSFLQKDLNQLEVTPGNFDEMCIAYYENDLDESSKIKLLTYIGNDDNLKAKLDLFGKLYLIPEHSVKYPGKRRLKQHKLPVKTIRRLIIGTVAAAASVMLILSINNSSEHKMAVESVNQLIAGINITEITTDNSLAIETKEEIIVIPRNEKAKTASIKKAAQKESILAITEQPEVEEITIEPVKRVEPDLIQNDNHIAELTISTPITTSPTTNNNSPVENFKQKGNQLFTKASNLTLTSVIQTGIKGINQMAETNLQYEAITDENGNITEYALSSESFNIRKKNKRNDRNL